MGALACAKAVIDNRNALVQQMDCMVASIQLNSTVTNPTYEMVDEFKAATNHVALIAAKIEKYVRTGDGAGVYTVPDSSIGSTT